MKEENIGRTRSVYALQGSGSRILACTQDFTESSLRPDACRPCMEVWQGVLVYWDGAANRSFSKIIVLNFHTKRQYCRGDLNSLWILLISVMSQICLRSALLCDLHLAAWHPAQTMDILFHLTPEFARIPFPVNGTRTRVFGLLDQYAYHLNTITSIHHDFSHLYSLSNDSFSFTSYAFDL